MKTEVIVNSFSRVMEERFPKLILEGEITVTATKDRMNVDSTELTSLTPFAPNIIDGMFKSLAMLLSSVSDNSTFRVRYTIKDGICTTRTTFGIDDLINTVLNQNPGEEA